MLTETQREIFNKILDTNWAYKHAIEEGRPHVAIKTGNDLANLKDELRAHMGVEAYDNFMNMGRKMFAPKTEEK
jgi:hypothetical protein